MVVCKYFQQGHCRFAQNCKFEHIYPSKYTYHANQPSKPVQTGITDLQLVNQVQTDIQSALNGKQWTLSVYAPFKEKPNFPGFTDVSPEETRLMIYEAKANNTLEQAVMQLNNLTKETRQKYEQLLQPTPDLVKALRSLYQGESITSPFISGQMTNTFGSSNAASSVFKSAVQGSSVFGQSQTPSIFGGNSAVGAQTQQANIFGAQPQNPSIFGTQNSTPSVFGSPNSNVFQQNSSPSVFGAQNPPAFAAQTDQAKSIFAQPNQNTLGSQNQNAFGSPNQNNIFATASQKFFGSPATNNSFSSQQSSPFNQPSTEQNVFTNNTGQSQTLFTQIPPTNPESFFGNSQPLTGQNVFGQPQNVFEPAINPDDVYSKLEELSKEDLEAFESKQFKLGCIPEVPPPQNLCT